MGLKYKYNSGTSIGKVRKGNEDAFGQLLNDQSNGNGSVFVVCDGMGGHVGGAVASQTAVNSIISFFKSDYRPDPINAIKDAISFANQKIFQLSKERPELKGMGTTCVILLQRDNDIYIGHVGDSRIYIHTDKEIFRLTKDHSYVQGLVDQGVIVEQDGLSVDEQMDAHPRSNELSRAMGIRESVNPEVCPTPIHAKNGDKFILCTDGLTGLVNDLNICATLNNNHDSSKVVKDLIKMANNAGGKDNITVSLVTINESPYENSQFINKSNERVVISGTHEHSIPESNSSFNDLSQKMSFFFNSKKLLLLSSFLIVLCLGVGVSFLMKNDNGPIASNGTEEIDDTEDQEDNEQEESDTGSSENIKNSNKSTKQKEKDDSKTTNQKQWMEEFEKDRNWKALYYKYAKPKYKENSKGNYTAGKKWLNTKDDNGKRYKDILERDKDYHVLSNIGVIYINKLKYEELSGTKKSSRKNNNNQNNSSGSSSDSSGSNSGSSSDSGDVESNGGNGNTSGSGNSAGDSHDTTEDNETNCEDINDPEKWKECWKKKKKYKVCVKGTHKKRFDCLIELRNNKEPGIIVTATRGIGKDQFVMYKISKDTASSKLQDCETAE